MKKIRFYTSTLLVFLLLGATAAFAQPHGHKNANKHQKEYYKKQEKARKDYYKHRKKEQKHYSKHAGKSHKRSWREARGYKNNHHVYFQDYAMFYNPHRKGYVYRHKNKWLFSKAIPVHLVNVDLANARIQYMTEVPLNQHPEYYYNQYQKRYPRNPNINLNISF